MSGRVPGYKPLLPFSLLPPWLVDLMPHRWWALGNLHFLPVTTKTWRFGVAPGRHVANVRTVEIFHREVAWGRRQFDFERSQVDGATRRG